MTRIRWVIGRLNPERDKLAFLGVDGVWTWLLDSARSFREPDTARSLAKKIQRAKVIPVVIGEGEPRVFK